MSTPTPIVFRIAPSTVGQSAELTAEQFEEIPFPRGYSAPVGVTPAGFVETVSTMSTTTTTPTQSLLPQDYGLEWVQGDTAVFSWVFTDVFWMVDDPGVTDPLYANELVTVTAATADLGVATLTTEVDAGYSPGFSVDVAGLGEPFDGVHTLTGASGTTLTFAVDGNDLTASDGTVAISNMPTWEESTWGAQVRNPYIWSTYAADYWVPAYGYQYNWWRGHSIVAEFDTTTDVVMVPESYPTRWGTLVTMTLPHDRSASILPGNWFRWDLERTRVDDQMVRTFLRGKARVVTEWTV